MGAAGTHVCCACPWPTLTRATRRWKAATGTEDQAQAMDHSSSWRHSGNDGWKNWSSQNAWWQDGRGWRTSSGAGHGKGSAVWKEKKPNGRNTGSWRGGGWQDNGAWFNSARPSARDCTWADLAHERTIGISSSVSATPALEVESTLQVLATTMGGAVHEVNLSPDEPLSALLNELRRSATCQLWQIRLIAEDGEVVEGEHRPLADWVSGDASTLQLTMVTSNTVPEHVHQNTERLFKLLQDGNSAEAIAVLTEGHVNVNARAEITRMSKGRKRGGASLLQTVAENFSGQQLLTISRLLLDLGIDPSSADVGGMQTLHIACSFGEGELALLLVERRADVTSVCVEKQTPLHLALEYFSDTWLAMGEELPNVALGKACRAMAEAGADPLAINGKRTSPLALAKECLCKAVRFTLEHHQKRLSADHPLSLRDVARLTGLPNDLLLAFGDALWSGWPKDYLPEPNEFIEKCFARRDG